LHIYLQKEFRTISQSADIYHFDAIHNIGLCGDRLSGGKIQGAWLSGYKLAERVINS